MGWKQVCDESSSRGECWGHYVRLKGDFKMDVHQGRFGGHGNTKMIQVTWGAEVRPRTHLNILVYHPL